MTKSERWILSEWRVALDRTRVRGERLLAHQVRTPYAEIDLLFLNPQDNSWNLVEVKTWTRDVRGGLWGPAVISPRQVARLERARLYLESKSEGRFVKLLLAIVSDDARPENPRDPLSAMKVSYFEAPFL